MGAHGSKEKLARSASERYTVQNKFIEQERFGRFGKRARGNCGLFLFFRRIFLVSFLLIRFQQRNGFIFTLVRTGNLTPKKNCAIAMIVQRLNGFCCDILILYFRLYLRISI